MSRQRFAILAILVAVLAVTGGSYRPTMPSLIVLRPLLVLGIAVMAVLPGGWDWRGLRVPAVLLAVFAATMAVQLVPLPPGWWAAMPGHDRYMGIVALAPAAWRPVSLVPDLTINGLLALLPAVAVLVAFAGMREAERWNTVWIVLGLGVGSAAIGLIQAAGGNGPTALATRGDDGVVTGFLANRNHGAVLLAAILPVVAAILRSRVVRPATRWLVLGAAVAIVLPLILLGGSRQGMALSLVAVGAAAAMLLERRRADTRQARMVLAGGAALLGLLVVAALVSGRAVSIERLGQLADTGNEARLRSLPILIRMTRDFWPFGIGYGAFDPVYRGYEPDAFLHSSYFNRAHNDLLETVMSGGIAALVPLLGLLAWLVAATPAALRGFRQRGVGLGPAGLAIVAMLLLASLVDYPLRTGIMSSVFAVACCWLATLPAAPSAGRAQIRRGTRR